MKEVELTGTVEEVYEKLKTHVGRKLCQYGDDNRFESILTKVDSMHGQYIDINTDPYGPYHYYHGGAPPFFLCIEEDETFEEMVIRKQTNIFRSLK